MLAIAAEPPETARTLVKDLGLAFPVLCDDGLGVIRPYGLQHVAAGPGDTDIAIPALLLLDRTRAIVWRHVAARIQDRADPTDVLAAVARVGR